MEEIKKKLREGLLNGTFAKKTGIQFYPLLDFIQAEINLAVSKERERVASKTDEVWELLCQMDTNVKSEKEYAKDIINLINTK